MLRRGDTIRSDCPCGRTATRLDRILTNTGPDGGQAVAHILAARKAAGLVDVKVARFPETHTAHKFAIPRARRRVP